MPKGPPGGGGSGWQRLPTAPLDGDPPARQVRLSFVPGCQGVEALPYLRAGTTWSPARGQPTDFFTVEGPPLSTEGTHHLSHRLEHRPARKRLGGVKCIQPVDGRLL